jgi:RhtB (resistance to homoserine/threonine) family protein
MEYALPLFLWFTVNLAATISPGPAFAMTVRMAIAHDRRAGLWFSLGLGAGVGIMMALVISGLSYVLASSAFVFNIIKYAGAAYLVYIGIKAIRARKNNAADANADETVVNVPIRNFSAFKQGLITNCLNPKALVFFMAVATQFITPATPLLVIIGFGIIAIVLEAGWFAGVTLVLTDPRIKGVFMSISHWIERACGTLLIGLGIKLALTKVLP